MLRSGSLRADLNVIVSSDPPARVSAQAPRFFVIYDSQFPLASSRFGWDPIQYRVGKTHCQGHQDPSKRVSIFLGTQEALIKMVSINAVSIAESYCTCKKLNRAIFLQVFTNMTGTSSLFHFQHLSTLTAVMYGGRRYVNSTSTSSYLILLKKFHNLQVHGLK